MKRLALLAAVALGLAFVFVPRTARSQSGPDGGCFLGMPCCAAFPDAGLLYCNSGLHCVTPQAADAGTPSCQVNDCTTLFSACCWDGTTTFCKGSALTAQPLRCLPAGSFVGFGYNQSTPWPFCNN